MDKNIMEGRLTINRIYEGSDRWIAFEPALVIEYTIDIEKKLADFTYDFGMSDRVNLDPAKNFCCKTNDLQFSLEKSIEFDLFHAFMHTSDDPNYSHTHWALFAYLKDRVTCKDHEEPYKPNHYTP
jgi:hypothetical protein